MTAVSYSTMHYNAPLPLMGAAGDTSLLHQDPADEEGGADITITGGIGAGEAVGT